MKRLFEDLFVSTMEKRIKAGENVTEKVISSNKSELENLNKKFHDLNNEYDDLCKGEEEHLKTLAADKQKELKQQLYQTALAKIRGEEPKTFK